MRLRPVLIVLALVVPLLTVLGSAPTAHAAPTSFTWTGLQSNAWGNPQNWSPSDRTPTNGDSVTIGLSPRNPVGAPSLSLAMLTVNGSPDGLVSVAGEGTISVGTLIWQGGNIDVSLEVGALGAAPSVISPMQTPLRFGHGGDQTLTILGHTSLAAGLGAGTGPWLQLMFDSSIKVASTGTLAVDPAAVIAANRCCTGATSTLTVDGTLEVFSVLGTTGLTARLDHVGLDWAGRIDIPEDDTIELVGGPVRVGGHVPSGTIGDASLTGGGTLHVAATQGDNFDAAHPLEPDGTMKFLDVGETLTVAEASVLRLGDSAVTSGVGRITGAGSVQLAGADVRGELTLDAGIRASAVPGTVSRLTAWDRAVRGQVGLLTVRGGLAMGGAAGTTPGAELRVDGGTRLVVPTGATLDVLPDARLTSGGCCTDVGRLTLQSGARMALRGSTGKPAVLEWIEVGGAGQITHVGQSSWDVPRTAFTTGAEITGTGRIVGDLPAGAARLTPVGVLTVDGDYVANAAGVYRPTLPSSSSGTVAPSRLVVTGTARLAGRLEARGSTTFPAGRRVVMLQAGSLSGGYACAVAPGLLLDATATTVGLRSSDPRTTACVAPAAARLLGATFTGRRALAARVPSAATHVLVQVKVSGAARRTTLTLAATGGGRVRVTVPKRRAKTVYAVVRLGSTNGLRADLGARASVVVQQLGWYV